MHMLVCRVCRSAIYGFTHVRLQVGYLLPARYQSDLLLVCAWRPPSFSACSSTAWTPRAATKRERSPDHTLVPRRASTVRRRRTPRERADACSTVAAASRCSSVYVPGRRGLGRLGPSEIDLRVAPPRTSRCTSLAAASVSSARTSSAGSTIDLRTKTVCSPPQLAPSTTAPPFCPGTCCSLDGALTLVAVIAGP